MIDDHLDLHSESLNLLQMDPGHYDLIYSGEQRMVAAERNDK